MTPAELLHAAAPPRSPRSLRTIDVAYTPDSDDAFNFHGWEHGPVRADGLDARFRRNHIAYLNHAAAAELFDVVAISAVMYPVLADRYRVLAVGTSVGRGYGPVLVAGRPIAAGDLAGCRVAVPDESTTGAFLARRYCGDAEFVSLTYHRIGAAILAGEVDAGVMIHEELVDYPRMGLHRVLDLGAAWCEESGLPLPVGLNLVHRRLGPAGALAVADACFASLRHGLDHPEEALAHASTYGRGQADTFVPMFSNDDTLCMPEDVRRGLRLLMDQVAETGLGPRLEAIDIVDPTEAGR